MLELRLISRRTPFLVVVALCAAAVVRADDTEVTGLNAMRRERPTINGAGIPVAHPEARESADTGANARWQANPVLNPGALFTWTSALGTTTNFPNSVGAESNHANGVGERFYSNRPDGYASGVPRVDSYDVNYFLESRIQTQTPIVSQVVNASYVLYPPAHSFFEPLFDSYAAQYNVLFVSGVAPAPEQILAPASGYNGVGVGVFTETGFSAIGPTSDGRAKPDLVAPFWGVAASFTTPQVAGSAAMLLQAARQNDGGPGTAVIATNASVIKALLINGAVKTPSWTNGPTRPLDARYGSGVLNVYNADLQLRGGRRVANETNNISVNAPHPPGSSSANVISRRGWDHSTIQSTVLNDRVAHYYFNLPTNGGAFSATATLVWKKGAGALANLELFLYETTSNTLVMASTSSVDNVEHIFAPKLPPGRYDLQVLKKGGVGQSGSESYALSFDFSPVQISIARSESNVVLSWPTSPAGFQLQSASSLNPTINWQPVSTPSVLSNEMKTVTLPAAGDSSFYRLFRN